MNDEPACLLICVARFLAAHHGDDVAVARVDGDQRSVKPGVLVLQAVLDRLVGSLLVVYVERRVDLQTALGKLRFRELARVFELLTDVVHKVRGDVGYLVVFGGGTGEFGLVVDGGIVLFLGDVAVGEHAVQHGCTALERGVVVLARVVGVGGLRDADEQRRL